MLDRADQTVIAAQMGRKPRGVVAVVARCPAGHPSVVSSYPLRRDGERVTPFPTLYWLTCPRLCAEVAHLERDGAIGTLEAGLARDEALRVGLRRDHDDYIAQRWAALSPADRSLISRCGLLKEFQLRGIGGMTSRVAVKCLHAHLAHHLARGNVIGQLVIRRYGVTPCGAAGSQSRHRQSGQVQGIVCGGEGGLGHRLVVVPDEPPLAAPWHSG